MGECVLSLVPDELLSLIADVDNSYGNCYRVLATQPRITASNRNSGFQKNKPSHVAGTFPWLIRLSIWLSWASTSINRSLKLCLACHARHLPADAESRSRRALVLVR